MSRMPAPANRLRSLLAAARRRHGPVRLRLDFENPEPKPAQLGLALLVAGLLACATVGLRIDAVAREQADLAREARAARTPQPPGRAITGVLSKASAEKADQANAVLARLSMPWDAWFSQLESAANARIVLTALQPEAEGRRVRLSGEARRFDDLVDYMMRLEATPGFDQVFLAEHVEAAQGGGAVGFTLTADWAEAR